jgi:ADP-heptose:LPS heptosyltransferase
MVIVGSSFGDAAKKLLSILKTANIPVHVLPAWNLATTGYALKHANLVIAPDTGLLHLCDYLGAKTIGIFGPTLKKKHGPFLDGNNIKQAIQIPCPHAYKKDHGTRGIDCMLAFTPQQMLEHVDSILNKHVEQSV